MNVIQTSVDGHKHPPKVFWGELAPCEHFVQIYTDTEAFLDTLADFAGEGLQAGEGIIIIATTPHLLALHHRLTLRGFNLESAQARHQYLTLEAQQALKQFMVAGWPDEHRFERFISELVQQARATGRRVRAFGEMVAVLWASGRSGATLQLERLWQQFCEKENLSIFCAYPRSGFTQDMEASLQEICAAHSKHSEI